MKNKILFAENLCKAFSHNGDQAHILSHIELSVYEGDFTVIMGASGSGKSTLIYVLSGMDRATSGKVIYNNEDIVKMKEKRIAALRQNDFGFVFQQMHLVSNLTLFENVVVPGYLNKTRSVAETNIRAEELLKKMNISHIKSHLPSQVSGGEQQRCAIARAIINNPKILFADEPTGALNKKNSIAVLDLFTELNRSGQTILMVTHDLKAALRANRLLYIEDGRIIGEFILNPYNPKDEKSREAQINAWLSSVEW